MSISIPTTWIPLHTDITKYLKDPGQQKLRCACLQDVLGLKLNRVTLAPDTSLLAPGASLLPQHQRKSYDVDDKDFFWEAAGALPFPKVGAAEP